MSLRLRLTLLYSTFMSGILLIFGAAVYILVNVILLNQVDTMLAGVVRDITQVTKVNPMGELNLISLPPLDMTSNAYVQVWGPDNKIIATSPSIGTLTKPLDPIGLESDMVVYKDSYLSGAHLRVLSVPLKVGDRFIGTLQVGASLSVVDATQGNLLSMMAAIAVVAVLLAGFGSWVVLGRALSPLEAITETVDQINRADDLSRRIPSQERSEDEIGELITSFNQTLERLESLFTSQQRFLADVSHELRTPLTVIKGNVDLMRHFKQVDEESLTSIDQEAGRLTRLVGGLLMLAQAESGKLTLVMKPVELDLLLTEVFTEMCVLAGSKVHVHLNEIDQVMVNGDRDRLKQVLLNLVANAIQYTPQGGEVFLSMKKIGDQARLIIRDTGPGIPAEDLPHIFDRFYRAEKSRTRSTSSGFGLGLSIAQWIVENHGGQIKVESKEGKGTTFVIWLGIVK
ncbi:MAG TPA: ATP-binding protein [Anaerolineales bacterium]|nr:ATP-binding protein [Anaerolineales bacterium]HMV97298.1 ATP-binding protein [Anaerolineales bacterium]HMX20372.1 ATP-binding protein [Anaerolineales bacterium]HMX75235.1 ATP-binding protein [Anaerolineales bacterium]HMZ44164.1 ATP-binding protein [Anaerolineales bacterium]